MTDTEKIFDEEKEEENEEEEEEENLDWEQRALDAEEKLNKTEKNFRNMAKRYNDLKATSKDQWFDPEAIDELVNNKISEAQFYSTNSLAKDHKKEIQEVQLKYPWMSAEDALNLHLSKTNPEVLTRLKSTSSVWVDGVDKNIVNPNPTEEEINNMTDAEFDEYRKSRK